MDQNTAAHLPCGVLILDSESRLIWLNPFASELLGYNAEELADKRIDTLLTVAGRIYFQTHIFPLLTLGKIANELYLTLYTRQRTAIPVLLNARCSEKGEACRIYISFIPVYQRREYEQELLKAKKTAEDALLRNDELLKLKSELERNQVQLDRQMNSLRQRNDELEQFSKIISHDLQEPLRKISVFAGMLQEEVPGSQMGTVALTGIQKASERLRRLVVDIQSYFAVTTTGIIRQPVDLTDLVKGLTNEFKSNDVEFEVGSLPVVIGDPLALNNLFRHLLDNAVKFRRQNQDAYVQIEGTVVGHNSFRTIPGKYNYIDYARITVSDNGIGFDSRHREDIFKLLKKLNGHTPGIGLGLALARRIVERHEGQITADSAPGAGTQITVWLPIA